MSCALIVIAKAPVPGRVKTRLAPPCGPRQAARLACAALQDTLHTVLATATHRRVCVLDGRPGPWLPDGFEVIRQREGGLDERLAGAFADVGEPALLIGMDTPQLRPRDLADPAGRLGLSGTGAVLGPAADGGYWAIGLRAATPELFRGVAMSTTTTGADQHARLREHGLQVAVLPTLRDVDTIADARVVAAACPPGARFPAVLADVEVELRTDLAA
jgi:rSAM/selenodomain-associated transferase 1